MCGFEASMPVRVLCVKGELPPVSLSYVSFGRRAGFSVVGGDTGGVIMCVRVCSNDGWVYECTSGK